ncbi:lytic transglycosylase domain-containing protein [Sciscionella marina]|uniref:lytic transglycosylase domain-containing protein n=1 Tax=Sciscionella marina TaxID=508770 RepID=UPI000377BFB5|nr:lytic murein transglycosylase [Sciscionella marina]
MTEEAQRPQRPRRGFGLLGRLGIVAVVLAVGGVGAWFLVGASTPEQGATAQDIPALQVVPADVRPGSDAPKTVSLNKEIPRPSTEPERPSATPRPQAAESGGGDPLTAWAKRVAGKSDIPERALWAYGNAELVLRSIQPSCHLSWTMIAGIGRVESNHGRYGGAVLQEDGKPSKPIVGVPLDGSGAVASVGDTDGGAIDGDPNVDRAVGPMQFIPSTWRKWASDANGDGKGDPQQIDDAALTAGRYLCAGGRDMSTGSGWWSGVMSYNNSVEYGQKVYGLADQYARAAR